MLLWHAAVSHEFLSHDVTVTARISPDHSADARFQADGCGHGHLDQRSWRTQPGLQSGRCHDHQGPH